MTEAMENRRDHYRRVLKEQSANADRLRVAYTRASEDREKLNSTLTLVALLASALTGTTALWAALGDTVVGSGAWVGAVVLWAIAVTGFVTTVSTTLQKTKWGSAELMGKTVTSMLQQSGRPTLCEHSKWRLGKGMGGQRGRLSAW